MTGARHPQFRSLAYGRAACRHGRGDTRLPRSVSDGESIDVAWLSTPRPARAKLLSVTDPAEKPYLVLQGGGALGAYQAGAYEALA